MSPEWIVLGVDAAIVGVMYHLYKRSNVSAKLVKDAHEIKLSEIATSAESILEDSEYVFLQGTAESATGKTLRSRYIDEEGLIQKLVLTEHRTKRNNGVWSDVKSVIRDTLETVPIQMCCSEGSEQASCTGSVLVDQPTSASFLMGELTSTYDHFEPNKEGVWQRGLDRIFGDVSKGLHETEHMLKAGTSLIGLGKLTLDGDQVKLVAPDIPGAKYILSKFSRTYIIDKLQMQGKVFRVLSYLFGAAGLAYLTYLVYRSYTRWVLGRESNRLFQEIRNMRNNEDAGSDQVDGQEDQLCVICLANRREVVLLECGHICVCADCAEMLPHPKTCPICRQNITRMVPTYVS